MQSGVYVTPIPARGSVPEGGLAPSPVIEEVAPTGVSFPNPNAQGNPYIYLAVYSSVPVYEQMVRGIGVMRRRSDSFMNATQILKVAGVDKGKRTKILEKDIALGVHEKIQGGYGRYQGTWIPFERAVELAKQYGVEKMLGPIFDYTAPPTPVSFSEQYPSQSSTLHSKAREQGLLTDEHAAAGQATGLSAIANGKRARESGGPPLEEPKRARIETPNGFGANIDPNLMNGYDDAANRHTVRKSSKVAPPAVTSSIGDDPAKAERHKSILKAIFASEPQPPPPAVGTSAGAQQNSTDFGDSMITSTFPPDLDPDMPIDQNEHTALHWAAALARTTLVQSLVSFGADIHRGNNAGETPLIRAVLVTNSSDADAFPAVVSSLSGSMRTVDDSGRTVLHHICLVAGMKGRASSARYYLQSILEYIARHEKGDFASLVNVQDVHGDTALNIAARVGNRGLVRMLLEVGADKSKANKLGLRPVDFGVEGEDLSVPPMDDIVGSLAPEAGEPMPVQKSQDVLKEMTTMVQALSAEFTAEMKRKEDELERTRALVRSSTKELAEQRKLVTTWRTKVSDGDERGQRIRNLERAIADEDRFDWTGRTEADGTPSNGAAGAAFIYRGPQSTLDSLPTEISVQFEVDPPLPKNDSEAASLVHLTRLKSWYSRVLTLLKQRIEKLEGGNAEQETRLRKIVAGCCGVEQERVEGMLESLVAALESDGSGGLDMTRVASFLRNVRDAGAI